MNERELSAWRLARRIFAQREAEMREEAEKIRLASGYWVYLDALRRIDNELEALYRRELSHACAVS